MKLLNTYANGVQEEIHDIGGHLYVWRDDGSAPSEAPWERLIFETELEEADDRALVRELLRTAGIGLAELEGE